MKKIGLFLVVILIVFWGVASYGQVSLNLMGPTTFTMGKGTSTTQTVNFSSAFGGPATLTLVKGSLSDVTISLNGKPVFGPLDPRELLSQLQINVLLNQGSNTLGIFLLGLPGAQATIQIVRTISNVTVTPSSVNLGEPGTNSQLKVTGNLNGTAVDITAPSFGTYYSSANNGTATVTSGGLVTAVALGFTSVAVTNTNFLGKVPIAVKGTLPTISSLLLNRNLLPLPLPYEQFFMSVNFAFTNPDLDVQSFTFTLTGPAGVILSPPSAPLPSSQPTGTGLRAFVIDSSFGAGTYQVGIQIVDAMGNTAVGTQSFTIDPNNPRFLEITGFTPASGKPGDTVTITGMGFLGDPLTNTVSFGEGFENAQVLSATGTQLMVVVPDGATTGTIGLMTPLGRTDSPGVFTIVPTITLTPPSTQLVTGGSTNFSCKVTGTPTYNVTWSATAGSIDGWGHFTAPSALPPVNPITLTCASADDSTVNAQASITVVAPAPVSGQIAVPAATGGTLTSPRREVTLTIPPGALASDTVISVAWKDPTDFSPPVPDAYNLAAVQMGPSGTQFSQPVTVVFSLRNMQTPGSLLEIYLADETTGALSDTGNTAIVDGTGQKAMTTIGHFSTIVAVGGATRQIPLSYFKQYASSYTQYFSQFTVNPSADRPFLEGLSVPVTVQMAGSGPATLLGPFLSPGFTVKAYLSDNTPLGITGPMVQSSADGWQLGTVINIPVLPNCPGGQTTGANLVIGFQNFGLSAQAITIPFTIECLDELIFSHGSPPQGNWEWVQGDDGTVTVTLSTAQTYRASQLYVGGGGVLKVNYASGADPATIKVTESVLVYGQIDISGGNGTPGGNGNDYWSGLTHEVVGGSGDAGGNPNGGNGGNGGSFSGLVCSNEIHDCASYWDPSGFDQIIGPTTCSSGSTCIADYNGYFVLYMSCGSPCNNITSDAGWPGVNSPVNNGGYGGAGGPVWQKGNPIELFQDIYNTAVDLVVAVESYGLNVQADFNAIMAAYQTYQEGDLIWNDENNLLYSAGQGGYAPQSYASDLSSFSVPLGGGGGGGAGRMDAGQYWPDRAGGGGGGGGGGAPSLKIVTDSIVQIAPINQGTGGPIFINGSGGNGGHGGDGSGGWDGQAPPGGGGGGGNGAQLQVIAYQMGNFGTINLAGGIGGASGRMDNEDSSHTYIQRGFGQQGNNGVLRVDGEFGGNKPSNATFYQPSILNAYAVSATASSQFCQTQGSATWCFNPQPGLNSYSFENAAVDPWQNQFVFYYPSSYSNALLTVLSADGSVSTGSPSGLNCSDSTCFAVDALGTKVTLQATPDPGYYFTGWSGNVCTGTAPTCTFSIGADTTVYANFLPQPSLTVSETGAGTITSSIPPGLNCGSTCQATYNPGTQVTLQATPSSGSYFAGWSGSWCGTAPAGTCCSGTAATCTFTLSFNTTVSANFQPQPILTVSETGAGTITSSPPGLNCGSTCQAAYNPGTQVTLWANPSGSYLAGWSGGGCSGTSPSCTITITANTTVSATFVPPPTGQMTDAREGHTATLLSNGKVLIAGGANDTEGVLSSAELYDPTAGTFTPTGSMTDWRYEHTATLLPSGKVLMAGGATDSNGNFVTSAELYDPTTGTFTPTGSMTTVRYQHTATLLSNGTVLIAGGDDGSLQGLSSAELYDPTAGTFTLTTGSMTTVRWLHTATLLSNGKVLIAGGTLENGEGSLSSAELYDPTAGTFTLTTRSMTVGRDQHTATLLSNGKVLIAGPISAELYDPTAGTFTLTGSMTYWRYEDTATLLPSGKVLMAGGAFDSNSNLVTSAELYDPTTGTFTLTGSMTTATYQHTATLLSNGEVLIAGGEGYYSGIWETLSEAELYNPATGTFSQP